METVLSQQNYVENALMEQRKESEVRAIMQDIDKLESVSPERKRRWVWELLQNAKDVAKEGGMSIKISYSKKRLVFEHDGLPFDLYSLLAIVRRTSTKSYDNPEGSTGKFGTGFVTVHALNKKVEVCGLFQNSNGTRPFTLEINRTGTTLAALQQSLNDSYSKINSIFESAVTPEYVNTQFAFDLNEISYKLASESIEEFKRNLLFTLLINREIKAITIEDMDSNAIEFYSLSQPTELYPTISASTLLRHDTASKDEVGILFRYEKDILIGIPFKKVENQVVLVKIENQARLYKEFPLIGTEHFHTPAFIQSKRFLPPEPRDGIRTKKSNELVEDHTADNNRKVLCDYRDVLMDFYKVLRNQGVKGLHLFAESGLPIEKTQYTAQEWHANSIQKNLRHFFLKENIVCNGLSNFISLEASKIPAITGVGEVNKSFTLLVSAFYNEKCPNSYFIYDWQNIISQDSENWPKGIICTIDDLVKAVTKQTLKEKLEEGFAVAWINNLIGFLKEINRTDLGETNSIYLDQLGNLRKKQELCIDSGLNEKVKSIGQRLNQQVYQQLLHLGIEHKDGVADFDLKGFYDKLNTYIGNLTPSVNKIEEFRAVFELITIFGTHHTAKERDKWYLLAKQILPAFVGEKTVIEDMAEYKFGSAEKASIKYICWLIEQAGTFDVFCSKYFDGHSSTAYEWLNSFIEVLFRKEEYDDLIRKHSVIPMQNGAFKKLDNTIYCEDEFQLIDELFKNLHNEFVSLGKSDIRKFIIDRNVRNINFVSKFPEFITKDIDALFSLSDAEKKVEINGPLNKLFHKLNEWIGTQKENVEMLFPHFLSRRPILYVKAFGPEVSKIVMAIHHSNKPFEEIQALLDLNISADEVKTLQRAAQMAGGTERLMRAAAEIEENAREVAWRKNVGRAAEEAFVKALEMLDIKFEIDNPDCGFDFTIKFPGKDLIYYVEIKNTIKQKASVKMSSHQGRTAKGNPDSYALCVIAREDIDDQVSTEFFKDNAKFQVKIGDFVKDNVEGMEGGLKSIQIFKNGDAVTELESEQYNVFVSKKVWDTNCGFENFITHLRGYFGIP